MKTYEKLLDTVIKNYIALQDDEAQNEWLKMINVRVVVERIDER